MKKTAAMVFLIGSAVLTGLYIWRFRLSWGNIPLWQSIVSVGGFLLAFILFTALCLSVYIKKLSEILYGFKFELFQLAFVSELLAFVIMINRQ